MPSGNRISLRRSLTIIPRTLLLPHTLHMSYFLNDSARLSTHLWGTNGRRYSSTSGCHKRITNVGDLSVTSVSTSPDAPSIYIAKICVSSVALGGKVHCELGACPDSECVVRSTELETYTAAAAIGLHTPGCMQTAICILQTRFLRRLIS